MENDDKRRHERFEPHMAVWLETIGDDDADLNVIIDDISAGGVRCEVSRQLQRGKHVCLSFELPQVVEIIKADAVVRHVEPGRDAAFSVGLEFTEVRGVSKVELMQHLEATFK